MNRDADKARAWRERSARKAQENARTKPPKPMTRTAREPKPRKALAPRSKRVQEQYAGPDGRRALVARLLAEHPRCQLRVLCAGAPAVDVDEIKSRARGGSILDPANCQTACRACHDWKHNNDAEALKLGLSRNSWD